MARLRLHPAELRMPPYFIKTILGTRLVISGAGVVDASAWGYLTTNVWTASDDRLPFAVLFDGVIGTRVSALPSASGEWGHADGVLYVFSVGNPALSYTSPGVEIMYYNAVIDLNNKSWTTIDGLVIERSNLWGALIRGAGSSNNTIQNSTIRHCGLTGIQIDTGAGIPAQNKRKHRPRKLGRRHQRIPTLCDNRSRGGG